MFYRDINLPAVVEIGSFSLLSVDEILKSNHIYFEYKILFTQKELLNQYKDYFEVDSFYEIVYIEGGKFEETELDLISDYKEDALFIAFGGGSIIDFVKMFARKWNRPYVTIPSTLSNDAIYSPIARLTKEGIKNSYGANSPIGIIINTQIIKKSPEILLMAGVGDLVSNLSAYQDCQLAIVDKKDMIDSFSIMLSRMSVDSILKFGRADIYTDEFIEQLAMGLIMSGLSMVLAHSSRPASGAEHMISHAIDQYFPHQSTYHGIQVAWAQLLLEKEIRKSNNYQLLYDFYNEIGILDVIKNNKQLSKPFFYELLPYAIKTRNRYTVLNKIGLTQ